MKYFIKNNLDFKKDISTKHAIIQLTDQINNSFKKINFTLGILIDLLKAFDTVDHSILIKKIVVKRNNLR